MVILDKIINDLKAKLPFSKKQEEEGDELEENSEVDESSHQDDDTGVTDLSEVEEDEEAMASNASLIHKLKSKIQSLSAKPSTIKKAKKANTDEGEEVEEDEEAAKKKKRSKIIQGVILLGLIAFLAEDYIIPKEEPIDTTPVVQPRARKAEPKPEEATATAAAEAPTTEATTAETSSSSTGDTTSGETVATAPETTTETLPDSPVDVTSTEVPSESTETAPETVTTAPDTTPETVIEEPSTTTDTTATSETPSETPLPISEDTVDGESVTTSDDNLTDQILQDLEKQAKDTTPKETIKEYVSPPDYEYRGRGLVYNCSGKHWACVDAPSYKTCEDNSSSTKFLKKTMECHPVNIYETQKGCEVMQNRMVTAAAKTGFCNE